MEEEEEEEEGMQDFENDEEALFVQSNKNKKRKTSGKTSEEPEGKSLSRMRSEACKDGGVVATLRDAVKDKKVLLGKVRYSLDSLIKDKVVSLKEIWTEEVAERERVSKEIERLALYLDTSPAVVHRCMHTYFKSR